MFLRNYDNYWSFLNSCQFCQSPSSSYSASNSTTQFGDGYFNLKGTNGSISNIYYSYGYYGGSYTTNYSYFYGPMSLSSASICLGTGNVPVTYEDYRLSGSWINLTLTQQSSKVEFIPETKMWRRSITCTCSNLTEADVVVNEWGIFKCNTGTTTMPTYSNSSSSVALMFREVLDTPITIAAGTTSTITFSIEIPMPNHP